MISFLVFKRSAKEKDEHTRDEVIDMITLVYREAFRTGFELHSSSELLFSFLLFSLS